MDTQRTPRVEGLIAALNMAGDDMDPTASAEADFAQMADLARELERKNARLRFELQGVLDWYAALSEPGLVPAGLPLREIRAALGSAS